MRKLDLEALLPSDQDMAFEALDLSENRLDNHICDVLAMASVPRLDTLRMTHNRITGVGVQAFARRPWPALRHLDLTHNQISIGGLRALLDSGAMPHLQSLRLADNPLDADITRSLIHHAQPGIKRLSAGFEPGRRQTTAGELVTMLRIHDLPEKTRVIALRKLRRLDRNQARALIVALVRGNRDNPLQGVLLEWVSGNLDLMLVTDLKALLRALGVRGYSSLRKAQLQALLIGRLRDMAGA